MKHVFPALCILMLCAMLVSCSGGDDKNLLPKASSSSGQSDSAPSEPSSDFQSQPNGSSSTDTSSEPLTQTVTIPEGYTLAKIGMLFEDKGFFTAEEFIEASQTGDFSEYPLAVEMQRQPDSCFKLEGLLFPDTYEVYTGETPDAVLRRMLSNTEKKLDEALRSEIDTSPYGLSGILSLASIIEKEAYGPEEMNNISSVLHNRLDDGMKLQCDVTIAYVEGAIKPFISGDKNRFNSLYNTYKCKALPAGPICNPGLDAIKAALSPADTDYLFFLTDKDKNYLYAATYEEHLKNVDAAGIKVPS